MKEAWRVLKSGGRYTFTVWCGPDQGGGFFKLVLEAIQKHGSLEVPLPPAPPMFRFADPDESKKVLTEAGVHWSGGRHPPPCLACNKA